MAGIESFVGKLHDHNTLRLEPKLNYHEAVNLTSFHSLHEESLVSDISLDNESQPEHLSQSADEQSICTSSFFK